MVILVNFMPNWTCCEIPQTHASVLTLTTRLQTSVLPDISLGGVAIVIAWVK